MKRIGKILGGIMLLYGVAWCIFFFFQDRFIFQSHVLPPEYVFRFDQKFEEYTISTADGEKLNALLFRAESSKGLILYFHGNANNLQRWGEYAIDFTALGYDVLMTDYRGYGKSTGTPTEENLYSDAKLILEWVKSNLLPYTRLIIYGRSLGSAVATNLAIHSNPDLLILETPFDKLSSALYLFSSTYSFSNYSMLPDVKCKRAIIHGEEDGVVPLSSALRLKPLLSSQDHFIVIEGGSHNDLRDFKAYHKVLKELLD